MTLNEARDSALRFHAQTLASLGEDIGACYFKVVLVYKNKKLDCDCKVMRLYAKEVQTMKSYRVAYFEHYDRKDESWEPATETRDLYKFIHNGFPEEHLIQDPENPELFYLPIDSTIKVKSYVPEVMKFNTKQVINPTEDINKIFESSSVNILDKPISSLTLRELLTFILHK